LGDDDLDIDADLCRVGADLVDLATRVGDDNRGLDASVGVRDNDPWSNSFRLCALCSEEGEHHDRRAVLPARDTHRGNVPDPKQISNDLDRISNPRLDVQLHLGLRGVEK
jgi:hypothetical protein